MISIRARQEGLGSMTARIRAIGNRTRNLSPVFGRLRPFWLAQTRGVFSAQGPGWAPLSPVTLERRRFPGRPMLRQTDRLYRSVTGGAGMIWSVSNNRLRYGSAVPYFVYHQRGTSKMPRRQIIVLSGQVRDALRRISLKYLKTGQT